VENPSAAMIREFEKAKTSAAKAKDAYVGKRNAPHNLSLQIQTGGTDIGALISQQSKLGSSVANLKTRYGELGKIMGQRSAALARRANLRAQTMDAIALAATLGAPIKAAADFESAMADVAKVVDFPERAPRLRKWLRRLLKGMRDMLAMLKLSQQKKTDPASRWLRHKTWPLSRNRLQKCLPRST
jgi:hypothetical protein